MRGVFEKFSDGALLNHLTSIHDHNTVSNFSHHPKIVSDEQVGHARRCLDGSEELQDRRLHRHVQSRSRLVADDEFRLRRQGPGNRDALALAAGEFMRIFAAIGRVEADRLQQAADFGLDLVEVQPNAEPPVCKILDYGKFKYEAQKRANEARKKQKTIEVKEIKFRPNIDEHDYQVKMRNVNKFLSSGDKVKVTLRFRGREMAHQELGANVLSRVRDETDEIAKVEAMPKMEGRQMVMVLAPR